MLNSPLIWGCFLKFRITCIILILGNINYLKLLNRPLAKVLFLTILDFDIYLKINVYH